MDIRKIRKLIAIMEESDINELEVHEGEESIRLIRSSRRAGQRGKRIEKSASHDDKE